MNRLFRWAVAAASTFAITLAAAPSAQAQVTFDGTSNGYFNDTPGATALGGLTFSQGFDWIPDSFVLNNPNDFKEVQFGVLYLDRGNPFNYGAGGGNIFNLVLNFTQPGALSDVFSAALSGNIKPNSGQLNVHFDKPVTVELAGAVFKVEVFSILGQDFGTGEGNSSSPADVKGKITLISGPSGNPPSTVTPEPISMALLGTGLAGVAAVRRRRKSDA